MEQGRPLTCQELVELVTDYFEGALPPPDAARFEAHLTGCAHCRTYLTQMRATIHALGRLPTDALPAEAMETLLRQFRDWTRR